MAKKTPLTERLENLENPPSLSFRFPCANYFFSVQVPLYIKYKLGIRYRRTGTSSDWKIYDSWLKENHPKFYWFEEVFLNKIQDFFCYIPKKIKNFKSYLRNRFFDKIHCLPTGLKKGVWYDVDTRLLHGMMETLAWFVEEEKANSFYADQEFYPAGNNKLDKALTHLCWEASLIDSSPIQAKTASEVLAIYHWWRYIRPNRKNPYEGIEIVGGIWDLVENSSNDLSEQFESIRLAEETYELEDESYIQRLIAIRKNLWT